MAVSQVTALLLRAAGGSPVPLAARGLAPHTLLLRAIGVDGRGYFPVDLICTLSLLMVCLCLCLRSLVPVSHVLTCCLQGFSRLLAGVFQTLWVQTSLAQTNTTLQIISP